VIETAEILRVSPQGEHTTEVLDLFRAVLDGRTSAQAAFDASTAWMVDQPCNGFWHGRAGLEQYVAV
jgi:O2-independent ubiquinone biosynthesis protein UbiV